MTSRLPLDTCISVANTGLDAVKRAPIVERDTGIKCMRIQDVSQSKDFKNWGFTEVTPANFKKFQLKKGDILIARTGGSIGVNRYISEDLQAVYNNGLIRIRVDTEKYHPKFVFYLLRTNSFKQHINAIAFSTAAQPNMKIRDFLRFEFVDLPLIIQVKIADSLSAIDDKIELNRQTNQTLEHMAQAIFKSWFVDFEPTRAKIAAKEEWAKRNMAAKAGGSDDNIKESQAEATFVELAAMAAISGRSIDSTNNSATGALAGLDQLNPEQIQQLKTTSILFPDTLVDSELGEIPLGWGTQILEDVVELAYGKALKKTVRVEGDFPVYGSGGLTGTHNEALVEGPGIIVGRKGTVGSLYWEDSSFFPIDTVFYVKPKNNMTLVYAYSLLQTLGLNDMNTDGAVPGLNRNNAYRLGVVEVPGDLLLNFSKLIGSFREKLSTNKQETSSLLEIRDSLLPKLLSGDLTASSEYHK